MRKTLATTIARTATRIAAAAGPERMRALARFNRYVTNPVQRLWAPRLPFMAVLEHTGRKSGNTYRTPVMVFIESGVLAVPLNYGPESDWVRNIRASGSAGVVHRRKYYRLTDPRVVPADSPELPLSVRSAGIPGRSVFLGTVGPVGG
ncbi:nitroreductase family deazaflavin-dependent oxidoreductase [Nocardia carnea]|uniref:nitroreductase family deazaflavin-dependent oxidoreductase n=1 Tax=Nocardia carnea TaxID=37328 RepID=UPI002453E47F|nr:nitroreductase family deazaflavin-dependent oxidoreductase [Nocardia carnea]